MKSAHTQPINERLADMKPQDIFRKLAQLQPHHKWIWKQSYRHWHRKNAL